ncbi:MAG: hypothetical protein PHC61_05590 [Chitinivibrionales bacterium]|nr:hypothetical protein [Chitinivibrionales bacterium]
MRRLLNGLKYCFLVLFLCVGVSQTQAAAPTQAAAAGFTVNTFSSTFDSSQVDMKNTKNSGYKWYLSRFFGWGPEPASGITLNSDKSATLTTQGVPQSIYPYDGSGVPTYTNGGILTAGQKITGGDTSWVGTVFGGGGYFELTVKINDPNYTAGAGGAGWWNMSIEKMANLPGLSWVGGGAGEEHFMEIDALDYHDVHPPQYRALVRELYGRQPYYYIYQASNFNVNSFINLPANTDFTASHKYGFLWVPATSSKNGYLVFYYDDKATIDSVSWSQFTNQTPPPNAPWKFGVLDQQHLVLVLADTHSPGMTVQLLNVWQKADNTGGKDGVIPVTLPAVTSQTVGVTAPAALKTVERNALTFKMDRESLVVTVGLPGRHRLEIVRPDGSAALRFNGMNSVKYTINRKTLPAGIYMLRATDATGNKFAKLVTWY